MTNVLIVEDSKITRNVLENYIAGLSEYKLSASLENAANADIVCMNGMVDLILMDVCTADDESGLRAAERIKKHHPKIRIIIMTSMPECSFIEKAKAAGCDGFWYKELGNSELSDIIDIMDSVMRGRSVYPNGSPVVHIGIADSDELTEQELVVLRQLTLGFQYEEIAEALCVSKNTVKYHIHNLLVKTGYQNKVKLVADVVEKKLILPSF